MRLLSLPEAATLLGVKPSTLRAQIRFGRLRAEKLSRDWYLTPDEVERYRRESLRKDVA